jgi:DNA-binding transcriptional LysR family regulator
MNYEQLFSFVAFSEHLSFTKAAKVLHISQPALFVQVKKLTETVGVPLYVREGRGLVLTAAGRRLAAYGRETEARGKGVLSFVRGEASREPVVLASGPGAFLYLLGPAIRKFPKAKWPLRLLTASGPEAVEAVRESRAHLAVVATRSPPDDLRWASLCSVGQHVLLPKGHRLSTRASLEPKDLRGETLIVPLSGSPHRRALDEALRGVDVRIAVEATGWDLALHFASAGLGLAIVNAFCPAPKGMCAVPFPAIPPIEYRVVGRHRPSEEPGVKRMWQLLQEI